MNQIQDRKALVDFLEDALAQAAMAQTPKCIQDELDQELKQALLEYEKGLAVEQHGTTGGAQSTAVPEPAGPGDATLRLLTLREPWCRALLDKCSRGVWNDRSRLLKDLSPPRRNRPID